MSMLPGDLCFIPDPPWVSPKDKLRATFAAAALQAILVRPGGLETIEEIVTLSYVYADKMVERWPK